MTTTHALVRDDWQLALTVPGLTMLAGVPETSLIEVALFELATNAADESTSVDAKAFGDTFTISDNGPGLDPTDVLRLFSVNRPLTSSKLWRGARRGALGNGGRVIAGVAAQKRAVITVRSRGVEQTFTVDPMTGAPVVKNTSASTGVGGMLITIRFPGVDLSDHAQAALRVVDEGLLGATLTGKSDPRWFDLDAMREIVRAAPEGADLHRIIADHVALSNEGRRLLRSAGRDPGRIHRIMQQHPGRVRALQPLGPDTIDLPAYAFERDTFGAMPVIIEAWVVASPSKKGEVEFEELLVNRAPVLGHLHASAEKEGRRWSADLYCAGSWVTGIKLPRAGSYRVVMAISIPLMPILSSGKAPDIARLRVPITVAVGKALKLAAKSLVRTKEGTLKDACYEAMEEAYLHASDGGRLPVAARQMFYALRSRVLPIFGSFYKTDSAFTSGVLPAFLQDHPKLTADWRIAYDARGSMFVPHENRRVALGTLAVEAALRARPLAREAEVSFTPVVRHAERRERLAGLLVVEKEGFDALFQQVALAERWDVAILGAKGFGTMAARDVIDACLDDGLPIFVLADFDVAGIGIRRTYAEGSWRDGYRERAVTDIGLRLANAEALGLDPEPVELSADQLSKLEDMLSSGVLTEDEHDFLTKQRVELNAMTSRQIIDLIEDAFHNAGLAKVVPSDAALAGTWRRCLAAAETERVLAEASERIEAAAATRPTPADLGIQVRALLEADPELAWEFAVEAVVREQAG